MTQFFESIGTRLGEFIPSLLGAIAILILGWIVATVAAAAIQGLLKRTDLDNRIVRWAMGQEPGAEAPPVEKWIAATVYWVIIVLTLLGFFNALSLEVASQPLTAFLETIFNYLPRIGGAALLLGVAWVVATASKLLLTRGLARFRLDDQLAQQVGTAPEESTFLLNETLGNILYWFIFLVFLPLVLDVLELRGPLEPVQNLLDEILVFLPRLFVASIIGVVGWLVARIVRGIVTNLLTATGADRIGERFGLQPSAERASLSSLVGTIVYVLILIPTAIAALDSLQIAAISEPAVQMLEQSLAALPKIFMATLIVSIAYVVGQFVAELVTNLLSGFGFNNIFRLLGLPAAADSPPTPAPIPGPAPEPQRVGRSPSEIAGVIVWVGIMLFAVVAATEVLELAALTDIVNGLLVITGRVIVGVVVFAIGLWLANIAFNIITSSRSTQANMLGQTARISILVLSGAMALQQMGVATNIVNLAFGLLVGAIAVAIALAFGLGGREIAAEQIREWLSNFKQ